MIDIKSAVNILNFANLIEGDTKPPKEPMVVVAGSYDPLKFDVSDPDAVKVSNDLNKAMTDAGVGASGAIVTAQSQAASDLVKLAVAKYLTP